VERKAGARPLDLPAVVAGVERGESQHGKQRQPAKEGMGGAGAGDLTIPGHRLGPGLNFAAE
jgi:hypothetical protein